MSETRKPLIRAWAGFVDGKADIEISRNDDSLNGYGAIYRTRREARKRYQDVRRIVIYEETQ